MVSPNSASGCSATRITDPLTLDDVHDTLRKVRDTGGEADEPTKESHGLSTMNTDDQGGRFSIHQL
ncbi:hypothetical protein [Actinomadura madurae]|uniref:hypothetical protein n=1 Tax=Actinomadura madurae TaxID=1993 RepID=UPI0020262747|nr:hypothetical protein [Actinomadura madurae]MCP9955212.1 hypothetical protein [Actinomadura madurae]MCP9971948.1 hypothetical protein [Actinomadura madurae]MCQ0003993.1 hypothetical protein [Actinomadura madurae]MCQ0020644.1 hypothetical protein [Actinomadura madurae]URN02834.1 hypothetical protein LUW74_05365 [Actinomadura madurae]